jgi:hypothetical protein
MEVTHLTEFKTVTQKHEYGSELLGWLINQLDDPHYLGANWGPGGLKSFVENSCEMLSMNEYVPARKAEGRTSFYAGRSAQSLYAQLGSKQAMASLYIVPQQLKEEIPRDNYSIQEVETVDQDVPVPVVEIPECYAHLFRTKTELAAWLDRQTNPSKS